MDKEKVLLFRERYKAVEEIETKELQNASFSDKFSQLIGIIRLARGMELKFPIENKREEEVRRRWMRLKKRLSI